MFEWEENVFLGLKALYKRLVESPRERAASAVRVHLAPRRQQLFLLANMIAEKPVAVFETPNAVLCDHERVFLPPEFSLASTPEANECLFQLKTILGALTIKTRVADPKALLDEIPALEGRIAELQPFLGETDFWQPIGRADFSRVNEPTHSKTLASMLEAAQQPEKVTSLVSQHEAWAKRVGVIPREQIVKQIKSANLFF